MTKKSVKYGNEVAIALRVAIVITLAGSALIGMWGTPSFAACPAPTISVDPQQGAPLTSFSVTGAHFSVGCNDNQQLSPGQSPSPPAPEPPETNIRIEFAQGENVSNLGTIDARQDYTFQISVSVPEKASNGLATVRAISSGTPATATFNVIVSPGVLPTPAVRELPRTGISAWLVLLGGTVMLSIGAGIGLLRSFRNRGWVKT